MRPLDSSIETIRRKRARETLRKGPAQEEVEIKGYTKADGTKVPDHKRLMRVGSNKQEARKKRKDFDTPEPTTAAGYTAMFDKVPTAQWGGADISLSVKLADGRRVWLFGDTLSKNNGFVHSTALVQSGGTLKVSQGGKQLIPDDKPTADGRAQVYWVEQVQRHPTHPNKILVNTAQMSVGTANAWDFKRNRPEQARQAVCSVSPSGDVVFKKWAKWVPKPVTSLDGSDTAIEGPNKYSYGTLVHPIKLSNGKWLTTRSINYDDPLENHVKNGQFQYKEFRPIFGEADDATRESWLLKNPDARNSPM